MNYNINKGFQMKMLSKISIVVAFLILPISARADILVFQDGRTLKVVGYQILGDRVAVEFEGGGNMQFSMEYVDRIVPDEIPPETTVPKVPVILGNKEQDYQGPFQEIAWLDLQYRDLVLQVSEKHQVDPALLAAVIKVESDFKPDAVSPKGAKGLMQLMDGTAKSQNVNNVFDPLENIEGGAKYLKELLEEFDGDQKLALAAYNAGPSSVRRYKNIPPYPETQKYVDRVFSLFKTFRTPF
jgi:hypothetical protein